jgi:nitroreductase
MPTFKQIIQRMQTAQWILIASALVLITTALLLGIADNLPGIVLLYVAVTCIAAAWTWNWKSPRDFWILLGISLAAFPAGVVLHNLLYALGTQVSGMQIISPLVEALEVIFFLLAVIVVGPVALVSIIGGISASRRGISNLTLENRSYRRFKQSYQITEKQLKKLVMLVRQSASGANLQPLKFILSCTPEKNEMIFPTLSWAGYLDDWSGPEEGERPSAYLVMLGDKDLANSFEYDAGIASQSITLGATEMGLGCCLIGSIKRDSLREMLEIPDEFEILLVIALGKPNEKVVLDEIGSDGDIKYWRDDSEVHHVPKRRLQDFILDL